MLKTPTRSSEQVMVPWLRVTTLLCVGAALLAAGPLIWMAVRSGLGIIALGSIGAAGYGLLQTAPLLRRQLGRRILRARIDDAERHPVEHLRVELLDRSQELAAARHALRASHDQVRGMRALIARRRREDPGADCAHDEDVLARMDHLHHQQAQRLHAATQALEAAQQRLHAAQLQWDFAQATRAAGGSLRGSACITDALLRDAAARALERDVHDALAQLECGTLELDDTLLAPLPADSSVDGHVDSGSGRWRSAEPGRGPVSTTAPARGSRPSPARPNQLTSARAGRGGHEA